MKTIAFLISTLPSVAFAQNTFLSDAYDGYRGSISNTAQSVTVTKSNGSVIMRADFGHFSALGTLQDNGHTAGAEEILGFNDKLYWGVGISHDDYAIAGLLVKFDNHTDVSPSQIVTTQSIFDQRLSYASSSYSTSFVAVETYEHHTTSDPFYYFTSTNGGYDTQTNSFADNYFTFQDDKLNNFFSDTKVVYIKIPVGGSDLDSFRFTSLSLGYECSFGTQQFQSNSLYKTVCAADISWLGMRLFSPAGTPIKNWNVVSASGFDYKKSYFSATFGTVPEPEVWLSFITGLFTVGVILRTRKVDKEMIRTSDQNCLAIECGS